MSKIVKKKFKKNMSCMAVIFANPFSSDELNMLKPIRDNFSLVQNASINV
jgi:hypothetical protein